MININIINSTIIVSVFATCVQADIQVKQEALARATELVAKLEDQAAGDVKDQAVFQEKELRVAEIEVRMAGETQATVGETCL